MHLACILLGNFSCKIEHLGILKVCTVRQGDSGYAAVELVALEALCRGKRVLANPPAFQSFRVRRKYCDVIKTSEYLGVLYCRRYT